MLHTLKRTIALTKNAVIIVLILNVSFSLATTLASNHCYPSITSQTIYWREDYYRPFNHYYLISDGGEGSYTAGLPVGKDLTPPSFTSDNGGGTTTAIPGRLGGERQLIFILIGLNYKDTNKALKGPWSDIVLWTHWATKLYDYLKLQVDGFSMTFHLLSDEDIENKTVMPEMPAISTSGSYNFTWDFNYATKENVLKVIHDCIEEAKSYTCVYFIFSGNGGITEEGQHYILLAGNERLTDRELQNAFYNYGLADVENYQELHNRLYFFFDCCYSGGMREVTDIYVSSDVAFFAACQDGEVTATVNTEDFVGHLFPDRIGHHGMLTLAFIEQYWDKDNNNWKDSSSFRGTYFELCWSNPYSNSDIQELFKNYSIDGTYSTTPVFIDGDPQNYHYFYPWWI